MNGNSIKDNAIFVYDETIFSENSKSCRPELLNLVRASNPETLVNGKIVSISEPGLYTDLLVCNQSLCVTPDLNGYFEIEVNTTDEQIFLKDNSQEDYLKIRYGVINKGEISISSENQELTTPTLPQTELSPIESARWTISGYLEIAVTQGEFTLPISSSQFNFIDMIQGFDHDPREDRMAVLGYNGQVNACREWNICNKSKAPSWPPMKGIGPNHSGIDFGYLNSKTSEKVQIELLAARPGVLTNSKSTGGPAIIVVIAPGLADNWWEIKKPIDWRITYGHVADEVVVKTGEKVQRGQAVAFIGKTGASWFHLHWEYLTGKPFKESGLPNWYSKDIFAMTVKEKVIPGFNDRSSWTVYNLPVFPY